MAECRHCGRSIIKDGDDLWIDPEATGDDVVWRETCDSNDTFTAHHEPEPVVTVAQDQGHDGPWTARCTCGWSQAYNSAAKAQQQAVSHGDETGHDASNA